MCLLAGNAFVKSGKKDIISFKGEVAFSSANKGAFHYHRIRGYFHIIIVQHDHFKDGHFHCFLPSLLFCLDIGLKVKLCSLSPLDLLFVLYIVRPVRFPNILKLVPQFSRKCRQFYDFPGKLFELLSEMYPYWFHPFQLLTASILC